jgi:hypothetical protein
MDNTIKFTEPEMVEIATLQESYQEKIFALGQLQLDEINAQNVLDEIKNNRTDVLKKWQELQVVEQKLINTLAEKYGDGSLNLKDGTFKPNLK